MALTEPPPPSEPTHPRSFDRRWSHVPRRHARRATRRPRRKEIVFGVASTGAHEDLIAATLLGDELADLVATAEADTGTAPTRLAG